MLPIIHAGEVLSDSPRWQSKLSRATGVTQQHLAMLVSGERNLTPMIERRIAEGLIKAGRELVDRGERVGEMGHLMLRKMKSKKEGK